MLSVSAQARPRPVLSVLGTCSTLTTNTYPADTQNWFDASKQPQVVFYAHLLFPLQADSPVAVSSTVAAPKVAKHVSPTAAAAALAATPAFQELSYAEAEWLGPDGQRIAFYGVTLPARAQSDFVQLQNQTYVPHTVAMAIGTRDLRTDAGQTALPDKVGQYTVRLKVDGQLMGLAFFRMLKVSAVPMAPPPLSGTAASK
jgi:hypothetical protein